MIHRSDSENTCTTDVARLAFTTLPETAAATLDDRNPISTFVSLLLASTTSPAQEAQAKDQAANESA